MYYQTFETNTVEPPLIRPHTGQPETAPVFIFHVLGGQGTLPAKLRGVQKSVNGRNLTRIIHAGRMI